jgi:hypothetical protein
MFLILIKKAFYDFWDNLGSILLINCGYLALIVFSYYFPNPRGTFGIGIIFFKVTLFFIYTGAVNRVIRRLVDRSQAGISDFLPSLQASWRSSFVFSLFIIGLLLLFILCNAYLKSINGLIAYVGFSMSIIMLIIGLMSLPYFFIFEERTESNFFASLKQSQWLFWDNIMFSLGLFIGSFIITVVSAFFFIVVPGVGSLLLWYHVACGLRLKKYIYLKQNSTANHRLIPWKQILTDEIESLKSRTLKTLIFPWQK